MGLMEVTINLEMRTHGDTLYMSGTKIAKVLFIGIDAAAGSTQFGLINVDPYSMKLMIFPAGGATGSLVGNTGTSNGSTAAMIPLFLSINCGLRLYTTPEDDEMTNVTYIEVTS